MQIRRLTTGDRELARETFRVMAEVFEEAEEEAAALSDAYLDRVLRRPDFWAFAALVGDDVAGGLTAHTLPMTRSEASEVFLYDIAVRPEHQRKGIGRLLVNTLRDAARAEGIEDVFVPADDEDTHALDFYRALGGEPAPVTIFTFSGQRA